MVTIPWLWAAITVVAAAAQTVRNAAQRQLTRELGTVGATHVRFLFGLPFALIFLAGIAWMQGVALPRPPLAFFPWVLLGAVSQIVATAMMLAAMGERSFVVTIAYTKTEPVQVALFGVAFLGDRLTLVMLLAIVIATAGVMVMSIQRAQPAGVRPTVQGLLAGAFFALSAIGFRGAIISLGEGDRLMVASFALCCTLALQAVLLSVYLGWRDRAVLVAIMRAWRGSLLAGFMGAFASQLWFWAFALTSAANVRTLALVEVLFAQAASRYAFHQRTTAQEAFGLVLIIIGVALLIAVQ